MWSSAAGTPKVWHVSGVSVGMNPISTELGVCFIVVFCALLWTAVAIGSHCAQSSWWDIVSQRYCLSHWLARSEIPSVWGWKAVERFCCIPKCLVSALTKWDMKCGSLSEIICFRIPNHGKRCMKYNYAIFSPVIVLWQGRKSATCKHPWSINVKIASYPLLGGRSVIRSKASCSKGLASLVVMIWYIGTLGQWVTFLFCWQTVHPRMYWVIQVVAFGQW